jgi:hypothetical protein
MSYSLYHYEQQAVDGLTRAARTLLHTDATHDRSEQLAAALREALTSDERERLLALLTEEH